MTESTATRAKVEIQRTLALLHEPGAVVELRVLGGRYGIGSGFFDDLDRLAPEAAAASGKCDGVYTTLNLVDPSLLALAYNRMRWGRDAKPTTADSDITRRRWLLIDCDAKRKPGISSTDAQHEAAIAHVRGIRDEQTAAGWPGPIIGDSGNGAHLLWRIDEPADDAGLIARVLAALAFKHDTTALHIDTGVYNPARISKLYGTLARKGDNTPTNPHRYARILEAPEAVQIVTHAQLETMATTLPEQAPAERRRNGDGRQALDLERWMHEHAPEAEGPTPWNGGIKYVFPDCPWREGDGNSAYVVQWGDGQIMAACQHATCPGSRTIGNHWRELRAERDPSYTDRGTALAPDNGRDPTRSASPTIADAMDRTRGQELPTIVTTARGLAPQTDDALAALYAANDPPSIFVRSGALTRIDQDEEGLPIICAMSEAAFRGEMARAAHWVRLNTKKAHVDTAPPLAVVRDAMALGAWDFPALVGITETPTIRQDGSIVDKAGYDSASRLYYVPAKGLRVPPIPELPTDLDVGRAMGMLNEPLYDFPFEDPASRANALAAIMTPALRPIIPGLIPLGLFDKPQAGTGGSLLGELTALITTGRSASLMTAPDNEAEWRKAITSQLLRGATVVMIDNVETALWAPSLGAVLTASRWEDRILGRSEIVSLRHRATWYASGNNLRLRGDLPRRCYWVRLDAKQAQPWKRDTSKFRHPHLLAWVADNRGALIAAILTLARAWILAGRHPDPTTPTVGNFEGWVDTLGGILAMARVPDFLANLDAMYSTMDDDAPQWDAFLSVWAETWPREAVTTKTIKGALETNGALAAVLPEALGDVDKGFTRRLGRALAKRSGMRYTSGLYVKKSGEYKRAATWRVLVG